MPGCPATPYEEAPAPTQAGPGAPCGHCSLPPELCVCASTPRLVTQLRILVLQHPREQHHQHASAPLALRCLPRAQRVVGLSWPSLRAAVPDAGAPGNWAVLLPPGQAGTPAASESPDLDGVRGLIVLDGTWSQAKSLWWRNAWLLKCRRLALQPSEPSIYGSLRKQPKRHCLSTLEAIAAGLRAAGEGAETERQLRRIFRTFVQRARDARRAPGALRPLP